MKFQKYKNSLGLTESTQVIHAFSHRQTANRQTDSTSYRQRDRQQSDRQTTHHTDRGRDIKQTDRQTTHHIDRGTDSKQTDRQTDRQIGFKKQKNMVSSSHSFTVYLVKYFAL
jgi:hypothetical protein